MRRYVIGLDEAGFGPNLGPLVIGATVWSLPAACPTSQLWDLLTEVLTDRPARHDQRLHVADSKQVYQSQKGLQALERGVFSFIPPQPSPAEVLRTSACLIEQLAGSLPEAFARQPWYASADLNLPLQIECTEVTACQKSLAVALQSADLRLESTAVEVVCPERFNQLVEKYGNKSALLSHTTFQLLKRVWPAETAAVEVLADKHGGRNRYQEFLTEYFPDQFFLQEKESLAESRYRSGSLSLAFAMQSERHLPVALASMLAKYIREICMERFNRYWLNLKPDLKPTKGYPQDAKRFRQDIDGLLQNSPELIPVLWRNR